MDAFLLFTPFLMLALVTLLVFAGCVIAHATRGGHFRAIVLIDFDESVVTASTLSITLTITRSTPSGAALPTITVAVRGGRATIDNSAFAADLRMGTGTRRIDLVTGPSGVNEVWTVGCMVGISRIGSAAVQNGSATARPRTLTTNPETFAFTVDTTAPTSVRVTTGFP